MVNKSTQIYKLKNNVRVKKISVFLTKNPRTFNVVFEEIKVTVYFDLNLR